ncbi:MAG TPA: hypothetical protein DCZ03_08040 [Gammaproteobacteria bacterium]|nr:hypothetical protein [Gammaproteobacteria bacterium]
MDVTRIEDPKTDDSKAIDDGVMEYGLSQVNGVLPKKWAFVAKEEGEVIGGATGRVHFSQFYLDNLWVKENHRSKGYGTRIHSAVMSCAKEQGCKRIQLNTLNKKAVGLYRRLNYETVAVIEGYVDGFNLYYMAKQI